MNESHFKILRKCQGKFDCLVFEMLYIKKFKPNLNVQTDSIRAKLFIEPVNYFSYCSFLVFIQLIFIHFRLDNDVLLTSKRRRFYRFLTFSVL